MFLRCRTRAVVAVLFALASIPAIAQVTTTIDSTSQATSILNQSLSASGTAMNAVQGFTASGIITYYWGGQSIQGNATVRAKGGDQFRLDADVPGGTKSVAFSHRTGSNKEPDGTVSTIPAHNTLSAGVLTFPYLSMASALADSNVSISYVGLADVGGRQVHQVRVTRIFPDGSDPDGTLTKLSTIDYFIDPKTFLVLKTADLTHPKQTLTESYTHEIEFDGYTAMSGIAVPTIVREKVGGQTIWELRVSSVTFNTNLTDADFSLQ
jgi:hypothetical protein